MEYDFCAAINANGIDNIKNVEQLLRHWKYKIVLCL